MADNNNKSSLYFIVGALVVVVLGLSYVVYQSQNNEPDLSINVSEDGIEVEGN